MNLFIDQMLHEDMCADAHVHARHEGFLRRALALPIAAALAAPVLVAMQGALPHAQVAALCLCVLPLASIVLLRRAGLLAAQAIFLGALLSLSMTLAFGLRLPLAALGFFLLACCEAAALETFRREALALLGGAALAALALTVQRAVAVPNVLSLPDVLLAASAGLLAARVVLHLRAEMARQASERDMMLRDHGALETLLADARLHFNRAGAVMSLDPASTEKLGLTRRDLSGRGFFERVQMSDRPAFIKALGDAADGGAMKIVRLRVHVSDDMSPRGRFVTPVFATLELRLLAVASDEIMALLRDVTPLVEAQAIIAAHRTAASEDRPWKDRLIANVSHELRTPLNAIIGFSEMLGAAQEPADERQRREYASIINASGQHLLQVVNSILDMSQIEAGSFAVEPEAFGFASLVDDCCDMMRLKAEEAGITIRRQLQRDARDMVADKRACRQILINLLSNAIKFTPDGGSVTIHAQQAGNDLLLAVSDTGIGIAAEHLPRLGDPFFQAQSDYARAYEGTGLGLSVVKGLVGLHGGAISIESAPGQGTCVTVRLPLDCRPFKAGHEKPATIHSAPRQMASATSTLPDMTMVKKIA